MKEFLAKYADSFSLKDAIKMIHCELDKAMEYSKKDKEKALRHITKVHEMTEDLLEVTKE